MAERQPGINSEKLKRLNAMLQDLHRSALIAATVGLGLRLDLYKTLADCGPVTSAELALRSGFTERWLREWLHSQAAAEIIDYLGEGRFGISAEMRQLLVAEDRVDSARQPFDSIFLRMRTMERLPEAFEGGTGFTWDDRGEEAVLLTEQGPRNVWYRQEFVENVLPLIEGIVPRLEAGARVVDVGCGSGSILLTLARAFPRSDFHGYDISTLALGRAAANLQASGLKNVTFHDAGSEAMAKETFDFVITADCLHDMAHPEKATQAIRAAIKPDGVWFIEDVDAMPSFEEEVKRDRARAAGTYATSLVGCLASSLSEPDGGGYGTLGLPEATLRDLVLSCGFARFERLRLGRPTAAYYVVRP